MKKVYSAQNITMVGLVRDLLESSGIDTVIRNQFLAGAAGELPPIECWPELWIRHDRDYDRARTLVDEIIREEEPRREKWICPRCQEEMEGQFTSCWRCGTPRNEGGETGS